MKRTAFFILFIFMMYANSINAQFAVGYYYDGNMLSLSTNPDARKMFELRVSTISFKHASWTYHQNGVVQGYFLCDLFKNEPFSLYSGIGFGAPFLSSLDWVSFNIPLGILCNPLNKLPDLYLIMEYLPMIILKKDTDVINTLSFGFKIKFSTIKN